MKVQNILILLLVMTLLVGCTSLNIPQTNEPLQSPTFADDNTLVPPPGQDTLSPSADELVRQARAQLIRKFEIEENEIFLISVEPVEWPDAGLGCPRAGLSFADVITPGYRIVFDAKGQLYTFHTDEREHIILCTAQGPDEIFIPP